jgi:hypothetical protein
LADGTALANSTIGSEQIGDAIDVDEMPHSNDTHLSSAEAPPCGQPYKCSLEAAEDPAPSTSTFHQLTPADSTTHNVPDRSFDVYGPLRFREFGEYTWRKRAKLQIQNSLLEGAVDNSSIVFKGLAIYVSIW